MTTSMNEWADSTEIAIRKVFFSLSNGKDVLLLYPRYDNQPSLEAACKDVNLPIGNSLEVFPASNSTR